MNKIGFFGGTFNPPHLMHKRLALEMKEKAGLSKIIVIPTFVPPHKNVPDLVSGEDRLEMCKRLFTEDFFCVSDTELQRKGKSYSFDTAKQLQTEFPQSQIYMIVGSDMLLTFHQWYRYGELLRLVTLCAASRHGEKGKKALCEYAKKTLGLDEEKGEIIVSDMPPLELSSTEIRRMLKNGDDARHYLGDGVYGYIKEKGLYR